MTLLRSWSPNPEQLMELGQRLLTTPLYMPDNLRNVQYVSGLFASWKDGTTLNEFYEVGEFGGLIGFVNIIPDWKCGLFLKLWQPKLWGATLAREGKKLVDAVMAHYGLRRISNETADEPTCRLYRMFGWELDGIKHNDFRWDGKLYDTYINAYTIDAMEDDNEFGK